MPGIASSADTTDDTTTLNNTSGQQLKDTPPAHTNTDTYSAHARAKTVSPVDLREQREQWIGQENGRSYSQNTFPPPPKNRDIPLWELNHELETPDFAGLPNNIMDDTTSATHTNTQEDNTIEITEPASTDMDQQVIEEAANVDTQPDNSFETSKPTVKVEEDQEVNETAKERSDSTNLLDQKLAMMRERKKQMKTNNIFDINKGTWGHSINRVDPNEIGEDEMGDKGVMGSSPRSQSMEVRPTQVVHNEDDEDEDGETDNFESIAGTSRVQAFESSRAKVLTANSQSSQKSANSDTSSTSDERRRLHDEAKARHMTTSLAHTAEGQLQIKTLADQQKSAMRLQEAPPGLQPTAQVLNVLGFMVKDAQRDVEYQRTSIMEMYDALAPRAAPPLNVANARHEMALAFERQMEAACASVESAKSVADDDEEAEAHDVVDTDSGIIVPEAANSSSEEDEQDVVGGGEEKKGSADANVNVQMVESNAAAETTNNSEAEREDLRMRQTEVAQRTERAAAMLTDINAKNAELATKSELIEQRVKNLDMREQDLVARELTHNETAKELNDKDKEAADAKKKQVELELQRSNETKNAVEKRTEEAAVLEKTLQSRSDELDTRAKTLDAREEELYAQGKRVDSRFEDVDNREKKVTEEHEANVATHSKNEKDLLSQKEAIDARVAAMEKQMIEERAQQVKALKTREEQVVSERESLQEAQSKMEKESKRVAALMSDVKTKTLDAAERVTRAESVMEGAKAAREKQKAEVAAAVAAAVEEARKKSGATPTSVWVLSSIVAALLAACVYLWLGVKC